MSLQYHRDLSAGLVDKYAAVAERLLPGSRVLDVGCHTGYFVAALAARGFAVQGIDADQEAVAVAQRNGVAAACADIESPSFPPPELGEFDVILLMDVLEHLRDPADLLRRLKRLLGANGKVVVTGPNVAYWAVRKNLLLGRWNYTDGGILDRTHLCFFTARTWRELLESAGYSVVRLDPGEAMFPLEHWFRRLPLLGRADRFIRNCCMRLMPNLVAIVFLIEAVPRIPKALEATSR